MELGIRFVGIRAHDLEPRADLGENTFAFEVVQIIEDTFSYIVMVRANGGKLIRWEVEKQLGIRNEELGMVCLHFPPDKIILAGD